MHMYIMCVYVCMYVCNGSIYRSMYGCVCLSVSVMCSHVFSLSSSMIQHSFPDGFGSLEDV